MIERQVVANYIVLILYLVALSFIFLDLPQTKGQWGKCALIAIGLLVLNMVIYKETDPDQLRRLAPLILHLPLLLCLVLVFKKPVLPALHTCRP